MTVSPLAHHVRVLICSPSALDPAIDFEAMNPPGAEPGTLSAFAQYVRTRDESLLVLREGVQPAWVTVRRLPAAFLASVVDRVDGIASKRVTALRAAVVSIDGPDPIQVTPHGGKGLYEAAPMDQGVAMAPDSWVQEIADRYGTEVVQELGEVALCVSRLPRGAKGPFGWWGGTALSS